MSTDRLTAALLAALGGLGGIPLVLAQLDVAGAIDVFRIDADDVPHALLVLAAIGAALTCCVIALALAGAVLTVTGSPAARPLLLAAALGGFATALMLWLPHAILIAAAVHLLDPERPAARVRQVT